MSQTNGSPAGEDPQTVARHARMYRDAGKAAEAHEMLLPLVRDAGRSPELNALVTLLESCHTLGHHEHLTELIPVLVKLCETGPDIPPDLRVRAMTIRARDHCLHAEYATALELCRSVGPAALDAAEPGSAVRLLIAEGHALARSGDFTDAERTISRASAYAERGTDLALDGNLNAVMGLIVKNRGWLQQALRFLHFAEEMHTLAGDTRHVIMDALNRGTVLNRLGRLDEARRSYIRARAAATQEGFVVLALRSSEALGRLLVREGETGRAQPMLLAAWRSARKMGCRDLQGLALRSIAELELARGRLARAAMVGRAARGPR
jgi:tetratricopeptide (TPR) repeat protein